MGQRNAAETVVSVYQRFLERRTWSQADLSRAADVGVRQLRVVLHTLQSQGMPLEQEVDHPHVYWSVPKAWLPGGIALGPSEVAELIRLLSRAPRSRARDSLRKAIASVGTRPMNDEAIATPNQPIEEQLYLPIVEDAAREQKCLHLRYYSAGRGVLEDRQASVHRVFPEIPARFLATCHRSGTFKWFRVDRIQSAHLTSEPAHQYPAEAVDEFVRTSMDGFRAADESPEIYEVFVADPASRWVSGNVRPPMNVEPIAGGVVIRVRSAAPIAVARWVLGLGGIARPVTPRLTDLVRSLARAVLDQEQH